MDSLETLTEFFGWCTAINMGVLAVAAISASLMRATMVKIHTRLYGLDEADLTHQYFQYLAHYKIAIFVLNLVPYIALRIMA
jgi:hypothetical protein